IAICEPTLKDGKQCLVFVGTRRSTEGTSKRLRKTVRGYLTDEEKEGLEEISEKIMANSTTSVGETLSKVVNDGVAFHNAGLNNEQRKIVERGFRDGLIKLIVATPTLAAGINMPARRVIVRDCRRYDSIRGYRAPLPIMEVKQMSGRAGRPGFDDVGEAILVAKRNSDEKMLFEEYVLGDSEVIFSRMATEPALRKHLLALIATSHCSTEDELYDFMEETFYAEYSDIWMIEDQVRKTIDLLEKKEMIDKGEDGDVLEPTRFGKRVSDLYIDPLSADKIRIAVESGKIGIPLSYLQIISSTPDMFPLYIKKSELPLYERKAEAIRADLFEDLPKDPSDLEYFLSALKTASMLKDWMDEVSEDDIAQKYNIGPGDIRNKVETAEWLLHSASEVAKLYNNQKSKILRDMTERIKYGIKKELLPLTKLEQIGRVRARTLYEAGYDTPEKFKNASEEELKELEGIGETISKKGKGERREEEQKEPSIVDTVEDDEEQSTLSDF
ncbi:MAG: helicase-related protein, partial [Thermoplasmatota archaeon]